MKNLIILENLGQIGRISNPVGAFLSCGVDYAPLLYGEIPLIIDIHIVVHMPVRGEGGQDAFSGGPPRSWAPRGVFRIPPSYQSTHPALELGQGTSAENVGLRVCSKLRAVAGGKMLQVVPEQTIRRSCLLSLPSFSNM